MTETPYTQHEDVPITEMTDQQLYEAYNYAKQHGPQPRLDELQLEIAQRWEESVEAEHDVSRRWE